MPVVPSFFLFGEAPKAVGHRFLHLESLDERSRPNDWNIRSHAHADLSHLLHITSGGGRMNVEDAVIAFAAPCVLIVPAGKVHGFAFEAETTGSVLTIADAYRHELVLRDGDLAGLFAAAASLPLGDLSLEAGLARLGRELVWNGTGHMAAVEGQLLTMMVDLMRLARQRDRDGPAAVGPQAELVARFREQLESRYRHWRALADYAGALGVTETRLRNACLKVAGAPPARLVRDRVLLEAKRALLYSNMTIGEAAFYLGFSDPAYFSRFFSKAAGCSPRAFRASRGRSLS